MEMAIHLLTPFNNNTTRDLYSICTFNSSKLYSFHKIKRRCLVCSSAPIISNIVGSEARVCLSVGTHLIPHPDKVAKGGEDAFFVSNYGGGVIAVADGVSGWAEQDVDPALFSHELIVNVSSLVEDEEVNYDPRNLIRKAHAATSSIGSATVGLRFEGCTQWSSSIFYVKCIQSQLSSEPVSQTFLDAMVTTVELMEEDIVVVGSDGLFDNVFDHEIVSVVTSSDNVFAAAKALANLAHNHSKDSSFDSPYSQEARVQGFDVPWWKKIMGMTLTGTELAELIKRLLSLFHFEEFVHSSKEDGHTRYFTLTQNEYKVLFDEML